MRGPNYYIDFYIKRTLTFRNYLEKNSNTARITLSEESGERERDTHRERYIYRGGDREGEREEEGERT